MANRFTSTDKWDDVWFMELEPKHKLLWYYMCDRCDHAGIWKVNLKLAEFYTGQTFDKTESLKSFGKRIMVLSDDYWWLTKFCKYQYKKLKANNKTHASVIKILERHNLLDLVELGDDTLGPEATFRKSILERDGYVCAYCNIQFKDEELNIDHVIPRSAGGKERFDNLVAACIQCNKRKWDRTLEDFCAKEGMQLEAILERVSQRFSWNPKDSQPGAKDKDKDKDKDGDTKEWNPFTSLMDIFNKYSVLVTERNPKHIALVMARGEKAGQQEFESVAAMYCTDEFIIKQGRSINGFLNNFDRLRDKRKAGSGIKGADLCAVKGHSWRKRFLGYEGNVMKNELYCENCPAKKDAK